MPHPGYEGTINQIELQVRNWFANNPGKRAEAIKLNNIGEFCRLNPSIEELISSFDPSYAQAATAFWGALKDVK